MSGLAAADTDVYRCVTEILFPPPYVRFRANATLVHVIGKKVTIGALARVPLPPTSIIRTLLLSPTEKSECFVESPQMQLAQSDDQEKEKTPAISAPVGILAVLVLLVLLTIIFLQVRALFFFFF